jgi:hypothetical protein
MQAFGMPAYFIRMVQTLFTGAEASVCINGGSSDSFPVLRGVRQGCPLAPYLFLFVGEALNIMAKKILELEVLEGIVLPEAVAEHVLFQYADDVDLMVKDTEINCRRVLDLFDTYGQATGLYINWPKSQVYWISFDPPPP